MIARRTDEGELRAILVPLNVGPFAAPAGDVVAQRGAVLVGRQFHAHHARPIQIDRDALDRGHYFIAGQRVLPRLQRGVPHFGFHQIHFAHAALILLEGGDALGIGRPQHDGPVAAGPARIVGGVAEVLDAVRGERRLLIGGCVAHPQVRVADEGGVLLVGRQDFRRCASAAASAPAPSTASAGSRRAFLRDALRALHVALPAPARLYRHGLSIGGELLEWEVACGVIPAGGGRERGGELRMVRRPGRGCL